MKQKQKKQDINYMDLIPVQNPNFESRLDADGIVTVLVEWTGFYARIAQKFFHRPRVSAIKLDEYGSFIWQQIDGENTVFALSQKLEAQFGSMEKGLSRLIQFLEIMRDHKLIHWKGDQTA